MSRNLRHLALAAAILSILGAQRSSGETRADKASRRCPDRGKTVTIGRGAYSSPMTTDRKTTIRSIDGRIVAEEIYSPNRLFFALASYEDTTTTVYSVTRRGVLGRRIELWSMGGCYEMLGLSNDGIHLVVGREDHCYLPRDYVPDRVMLTFIEFGKSSIEIGLDRLVSDPASLESTDSGYYWGRYLLMNREGAYVVELAGGEYMIFDVASGDCAAVESHSADPRSGTKLYHDPVNCYEYSYPEDLQFIERRGYGDVPDGSSVLKDDKGTVIWVDLLSLDDERWRYDADTLSLEEYVMDQVALRCDAGGAGSNSYASGAKVKRRFSNAHDLRCIEFEMAITYERYSESREKWIIDEEGRRGPFFAVELSIPYRVLLLELEERRGGDPKLSEVLRGIADSVAIMRFQ